MNQSESSVPIYIAPCVDIDEMHARVFPHIRGVWRAPEDYVTNTIGTICWHIKNCPECQDALNRAGDEESEFVTA